MGSAELVDARFPRRCKASSSLTHTRKARTSRKRDDVMKREKRKRDKPGLTRFSLVFHEVRADRSRFRCSMFVFFPRLPRPVIETGLFDWSTVRSRVPWTLELGEEKNKRTRRQTVSEGSRSALKVSLELTAVSNEKRQEGPMRRRMGGDEAQSKNTNGKKTTPT